MDGHTDIRMDKQMERHLRPRLDIKISSLNHTALHHIHSSLQYCQYNCMLYCWLKTGLLQLTAIHIPTSTLQKSSEFRITLPVLFVVTASFNDHLKTYCISYTGYQSDNESIIK